MAAAVNVRSHVAPPRFFEEDPVIWLVQLDLYFCQAAVDDQLRRFQITATLLPGHLLRDFADILRNPPAVEPYTTLADAIQQRFGKSVEQRLRSLLSDQQLGDRRPSHFLRHLLDLAQAEGSKDSPLVRQIFLNAMPPRVLPFLQCLPSGTELSAIATTADRLLELPQPSTSSPGYMGSAMAGRLAEAPQANTVQAASSDLSVLLQQMIAGITSLTATVTSLVETTSRRERSISRPRGRSSSGYRQPATHHRSQSTESNLCYYHQRFGASAHSCRSPCSWSGNEQ